MPPLYLAWGYIYNTRDITTIRKPKLFIGSHGAEMEYLLSLPFHYNQDHLVQTAIIVWLHSHQNSVDYVFVHFRRQSFWVLQINFFVSIFIVILTVHHSVNTAITMRCLKRIYGKKILHYSLNNNIWEVSKTLLIHR